MKLSLPSKKHPCTLSEATAQQILSGVFAACRREPNSVPLEALTAYSNYRKERYALQRTIVVLMLILFLLVPLLFMAARVQITLVNPDGMSNPVYAATVHSRIPIQQIQAELDGQTVPLYEVAPGEYTLAPRDNGKLHLRVTLLNRQMTDVDFTVLSADSDVPALLSTEFDDDCIHLTVQDASGLDCDAITAIGEDGEITSPLRCDADSGRITLPYPQKTVRVRIPDMRGNTLEVLLRPQQ